MSWAFREASTHRSLASLIASLSAHLSFSPLCLDQVNAYGLDARRTTTVNEVTNVVVPLELTCHLNLFNSLFSLYFVCHRWCMHAQASTVHRALCLSTERIGSTPKRKHFCFSYFVKFCFGAVVVAAADTHYRRHSHVMGIQKNRNSRNSILNNFIRLCSQYSSCAPANWLAGSTYQFGRGNAEENEYSINSMISVAQACALATDRKLNWRILAVRPFFFFVHKFINSLFKIPAKNEMFVPKMSN